MGVNYNPKIVTDGLQLYLDAANPKSYPGSGTTWTDLSDNQNNGTLLNGVGYDNQNKGSLTFNGSNQRIDLSASSFNLSNFSISLYFKTNNIATDYLRLIHKADTTGSTRGFLIANSNINGKLVFAYQPSYTTGEILRRSTTIITTSTYYNVVMSYSTSSGIEIYFNGIKDIGETSTSPDTAWGSNSGNLFSIGSRAGGFQNFNGNISQVSIYNRALTAQEIKQNFNALRGRYGI
jgi:hypothetical protein